MAHCADPGYRIKDTGYRIFCILHLASWICAKHKHPADLGAPCRKWIRKDRFILLFSFYGAGDEEYNHALY